MGETSPTVSEQLQFHPAHVFPVMAPWGGSQHFPGAACSPTWAGPVSQTVPLMFLQSSGQDLQPGSV